MRRMRRSVAGLCFVLLWGCSSDFGKSPVPPAPETTAEVPPIVIAPKKDPKKKYFPEGSPSHAIQDLDDQLDSYILSPQTDEEKRYNDALKKQVLHGTFDIGELCRLAMAGHWKEISGAEQRHFVDLMTRLLEKKAVFSKEQGGKKQKGKGPLYSVTYEGHRFLNPEQTLSLVRSLVHIPSEDLEIELNYRLKKAETGWKIYDVIVDGASLLDNYKFQFDKIIKKDGYPTLVHRMESKLAEIEAKS